LRAAEKGRLSAPFAACPLFFFPLDMQVIAPPAITRQSTTAKIVFNSTKNTPLYFSQQVSPYIKETPAYIKNPMHKKTANGTLLCRAAAA